MKIEEALDEFIRDKHPRTLILQGSWGRGKTHLWNARWDSYAVQQAGANLAPRRYAYVSLFGLNSISEVNVAIGLASFENAPPETPAATPPWSQPFKRFFAAAVRMANEIPTTPFLGVDTKQITQVIAHGRAKKHVGLPGRYRASGQEAVHQGCPGPDLQSQHAEEMLRCRDPQ